MTPGGLLARAAPEAAFPAESHLWRVNIKLEADSKLESWSGHRQVLGNEMLVQQGNARELERAKAADE